MRTIKQSLMILSFSVGGLVGLSSCVQSISVNSTTSVIYVLKRDKLLACVETSEGLKCNKTYSLP